MISFPKSKYDITHPLKLTWNLLPLMQFMYGFSQSTLVTSLRTALRLGCWEAVLEELAGLFSSGAGLLDFVPCVTSPCFLSCLTDGCRGGSPPDEPKVFARALVIRIVGTLRLEDPVAIVAFLIDPGGDMPIVRATTAETTLHHL